MEIESSSPRAKAKKLWNNVARTVLYMLKTGMSKTKLLLDLQFMLKRGKNFAVQFSNNLIVLHNHQYYSTLTCRSNDFVCPREYEFSCSNSPVLIPRRRRSHRRSRSNNNNYNKSDDDIVFSQKVFEMLNNNEDVYSPLAKSPMVRQLRVTDSPFPLKDSEEATNSCQVDKDAEEFIKRFYRDLKQQKKIAALQSPSPCHVWAR